MLETNVPNPGVGGHLTPDFSKPPPMLNFPQGPDTFASPNIHLTPNRFQMPPPKFGRPPFRPQHNNAMLNSLPDDFDGKRLRKSTMRKTVDYNAAIVKYLENRVWQRDYRDRRALQPDVLFLPELLPPHGYKDNPINSVTTRFVKTATNKMRCPIFCMAWTPEGRRLVTGASSGEFTLWNGLTFNFETILQAHDSPVRSMVWSNNDGWMITGDHAGYCKYWQSNMNNVKMFQAHKEAIRGLRVHGEARRDMSPLFSFSPTDSKMVSCSDDGTLRIWDFARCFEERVLRGHGADVKCCDWHPQLGLIASGSKDNQQPVKLWDPKSGQSLTTLHAHKSTVMDLKWNKNGNWFMTASRDHFLKLFDLRNLSTPVQTFRGHKKEASCLAWHPHHEGLIASGGSDGAILFWHVGADKEVGAIEMAHESIVWTLAWHPLGHILCSGSNDHTSKFWTRNRPGDQMRDKYNLNTLPAGATGDLENEVDDVPLIPGMAPEDRVEPPIDSFGLFKDGSGEGIIPGLEDEVGMEMNDPKKKKPVKKQPYAKPIPKNFVAQWNETGMTVEEEEEALEGYGTESVLDPINQLLSKAIEQQPGVIRLDEFKPDAVVAFGKVIYVKPGQKLYSKIFKGRDTLLKFIQSGKIKELHDVLPLGDNDGDFGGYETDSNSSEMDVDENEEPLVVTNMDDKLAKYMSTLLDQHVRPSSMDKDYRNSNQMNDEDMRHGPPQYMGNMGNMGPNMGNMGPNMGNMGPNMGNMGPNMGNMGPNMGNMGPNMGPNMCGGMGPNMMGMGPNMMGMGPMGGPNMGNMGGPNMGNMRGGRNMGPMGGPNIGNMGGPHMGNMGGPNMGMGGPNMGNMGGPNMGNMGPNMGNMGNMMGPNMGGMGGPNMGGPNMGGPNMGGPNMEGPNMRNRGPNFNSGMPFSEDEDMRGGDMDLRGGDMDMRGGDSRPPGFNNQDRPNDFRNRDFDHRSYNQRNTEQEEEDAEDDFDERQNFNNNRFGGAGGDGWDAGLEDDEWSGPPGGAHWEKENQGDRNFQNRGFSGGNSFGGRGGRGGGRGGSYRGRGGRGSRRGGGRNRFKK